MHIFDFSIWSFNIRFYASITRELVVLFARNSDAEDKPLTKAVKNYNISSLSAYHFFKKMSLDFQSIKVYFSIISRT